MMLDLDAIKARLAAATPGPWEIHQPRINIAVVAVDEDHCITEYVAERVRLPENAVFIINAPADIAALIEEIERLRDQRDVWKEEANRGFDWETP